MAKKDKTKTELYLEIEELRLRLREAEETLDAIRSGAVDALVVSASGGDQVYTLQGAEHMYRVLVESMHEGALALTEDGAIIYCNRAFANMAATACGKLTGCRLRELISENDFGKFDLLWQNALLGGATAEFELKLNGGLLPVYISCSTRLTDGVPSVFAVVTDISERKQAEKELREINETLEQRVVERTEKLRESEERYRSIFEGANDGIIACDLTTGKFLFVNKRMSALLGYSAEKILKLGVKDLHPPKDLPYVLEEFNEMAAGKKAETRAVPVLRKDGGIIYCDVSSSFSGKTVLISFFRDVTDRHNAEEDRERLIMELEKSNNELEQFAYIASHDLQEPLRMVTSYLDIINKRYRAKLEKDAGEFIDYAAEGAIHMKTLLNDLLMYSRVGSKGKSFELTDLNAALKSAISNLKRPVEESGAQITFGDLPGVYVDETQIVQLFQNLIGNALKFSGNESPRINISSELKGDEWTIRVSDNGIGIDPKFFTKIFLIFQRLHPKEKYEGTGIGLAICKKIVERHGGRIWVDSEPGKGSTFYFTVPAKAEGDGEETMSSLRR